MVGTLLCGGITVFNPIVQSNVVPTDKVGVIGIGGLGHLALKFLNAWGCEVTAFTSSDSKRDEALQMGAHRVVNSKNEAEMAAIAGTLNFIISTVNVTMKWDSFVNALAPKGKLHTVGVTTEPIPYNSFPMIVAQRSIGGSGLGSPATTERMLEFCVRHSIAPTTESFKLSQINEALEHLHAGKARYRVVLENDLG